MREISFWILLFWGGNLWASHGLVQTSEGERFEGEIRLECGAVVVSDTNRQPVRVELGKVSLLQLPAPTPENIPNPTGRSDISMTNLTGPKLPPGIQLASGSLIARGISSADDTAVHFFDNTNETVLSMVNVAKILFQPMPRDLEERVRSGRPGVFLSSLEFVEGQFKGYTQGQIKISSVLFGNVSYDPGQVIAVILRETRPVPSKFELKTRDDSLFLADSIRVEKDSALLEDARFCGIRIGAAEIVELKRVESPAAAR